MGADFEKTQMADAGRTQMVSPGAEATQMGITVKCPVCGSVTPGGEIYCSDCGFLLSSQPVEVAPEEAVVLGKLVETSTGREFELIPGVNTIGRQDTDVLVSHPTVSRSHAKLTVSGGTYTLEDTGSTNGTFVGNKKVEPGQPVTIQPGAEILFGSAMMKLEAIAPEQVVEPVEVEQPAEIPPAPPVEAEPVEQEAVEESEVAEIPIATGPDEATDATPEQSLEPPIQPEEIHEEPALGRFIAADGTEYPIKVGENTIGRRETNDIAIPDPYISGSHATITASEGKFTLTDTGSTNGTFVNGEKLAAHDSKELADGDEVKFAEVVVKLAVSV